MARVIVGRAVPDFSGRATGQRKISSRELRGGNVVMYFYPKDDTSGCTAEGQDFRDRFAKFKRSGTSILGVSRDSLKSHEKFKEKYGFQFDLIADEDEKLCKLFDVIKEKSMYGRKFLGIERSTFLIDSEGVLRQEWRKVKVKGHADEVLEAVKAL